MSQKESRRVECAGKGAQVITCTCSSEVCHFPAVANTLLIMGPASPIINGKHATAEDYVRSIRQFSNEALSFSFLCRSVSCCLLVISPGQEPDYRTKEILINLNVHDCAVYCRIFVIIFPSSQFFYSIISILGNFTDDFIRAG